MNTLSTQDGMTTASAEPTAVMVSNHGATAAPVRPVLSFRIPAEDDAFFHKVLPVRIQRDVRHRLELVKTIHQSGNTARACRVLADKFSVAHGERRGMSAATLKRLHRSYTCGCRHPNGDVFLPGDWRVLWDKAKFPLPQRMAGARKLPAEFVKFIRAMADNNQRGFAQARVELLHLWRERQALNELDVNGVIVPAGSRVRAIPGYDIWPQAEAETGIPAGWSERNLYHVVKADNFEKAAARVGLQAASTHRLKVFTTRVGLLPGEFFQFDDHEFNVKIIVPGSRVFLRPRGFFAMDVLSASCFAEGLKPTLWDASLEKKEALKQEDFYFFIAFILTQHGYRTDGRGTTLVLEHGTAAITPDSDFETRLFDCVPTLDISRSGKFNRAAHVGQLPSAHPGKGKGNFRFKALVEGFFNLVDNAFATMPGQTGLNRDRFPEQMKMIEAECRDLLRAAESLTPEQMAQLKFPLLTWNEFYCRATNLLDVIDRRTEHKIEGWEKLGFLTRPLLDDLGNIVTPARLLSPREVRTAGFKQLTRLPRYKIPALLGEQRCYRTDRDDTVLVRDGMIQLDSREITADSDSVRFVARDYNGDRLKNGERFRAYYNSFDPDVLIVCDAQNRPLGECPRIVAPCRNDIAGIREAQGRAAAWQRAALEEMNSRNEGRAAAITARREHNGDIINGRPLAGEARRLTAEEKLAALAREARMGELGSTESRPTDNESDEDLAEMARAARLDDYPGPTPDNHNHEQTTHP